MSSAKRDICRNYFQAIVRAIEIMKGVTRKEAERLFREDMDIN